MTNGVVVIDIANPVFVNIREYNLSIRFPLNTIPYIIDTVCYFYFKKAVHLMCRTSRKHSGALSPGDYYAKFKVCKMSV